MMKVFVCIRTQAECDSKLNVLTNIANEVHDSIKALGVRIYELDEQLVRISNNPDTPAEAFEELEALINMYSRLQTRLSNKHSYLLKAIRSLQDDRNHCERLCYKCKD
jgi:hypothetical protein